MRSPLPAYTPNEMFRIAGHSWKALFVGISVAAVVLPASALASVTWESVAAAPAGSYVSLATDGTDLAAVVSSPSSNSVVLRTSAGWETLTLPGGLYPRIVALSSDRLLVAAAADCGAVSLTEVWLVERASRTWSRLPDIAVEVCEDVVGLELVEGIPLVLTSRCRAFRLSGSTWETPSGWPERSGPASCSRTFVRDSGRLSNGGHGRKTSNRVRDGTLVFDDRG